MKKITLILYFLIILTITLFSVDINEYKQIEVFTVENGNEAGRIGLKFGPVGPHPPNSFFINVNNEIYVPDPVNFRVNVYDINFKFIRDFKVEYDNCITYSFKISDMDRMILLDASKNLVQLEKDGNLIFKIFRQNLPSSVRGKYEYFLIEDKILFYTESNEICLINPDSSIIQGDKVKNFLKDIKNHYPILKENISNKIKAFQEEKKIIYIGKLFSGDIEKHRDLYKILKNNVIKTSNSIDRNIIDKKEGLIEKLNNFRLIGYDQDNNSYWSCDVKECFDPAILICTQFGEVIDVFFNKLKIMKIAISPAGDVYFMDFDKKGTHFYKTTRRW